MIDVGEAAAGTPLTGNRRLVDAEGLSQKFFQHAVSLFYLSRGTFIPEIPAQFWDPGSVNVLARVALETFLIFHHIFIAQASKDEKDFRYWAWSLSGLLDRQQYKPQTPEGVSKLAQEKAEIDNLRTKFQGNAHFNSLTNNQRRNVLQKGIWRSHSWSRIGLEAGLSRTYAELFYRYLSGYAHASSLSTWQTHQATTAQVQQDLIAATLDFVMIAMTFMIRSYAGLFPQAKDVIPEAEKRHNILQIWTDIGSNF